MEQIPKGGAAIVEPWRAKKKIRRRRGRQFWGGSKIKYFLDLGLGQSVLKNLGPFILTSAGPGL